MATATKSRRVDPQIAALRLAMARLGWRNAELAAAIGVSSETVANNFGNEFSSRSMRRKVNKVFAPLVIFTEGIGK